MLIELLKVIVLGIVEGITEWLPISSTGHMILINQFIQLDVSDAFREMFFVVIQLGAVLAVVLFFWNKLYPFSKRKSAEERAETINLWILVLIASVPAGIVGVLFNDYMDELFYKYIPVSIALIVYGIAFIVIERNNHARAPKITRLQDLDVRTALIIGAFQMLSLIPGTSRSGSTIIGAMLIGVSRTIAAEFSFFMSIPAMFGASFIKLVKFGLSFRFDEFVYLSVGFAVAFIVSVFAIRFLMGYIKKHDFTVFGIYRIILGALVLLYAVLH